MKSILICILIILFPPITYAQLALGGIWECVNKSGIKISGNIQSESFPFWIKFNGDQVLISNSNNTRISSFGQQWTYMKGNWQMSMDTLILHINETRDISTNTGFYKDQYDSLSMIKRFESFYLKFIIHQTSENNLQLTPLNYFLGYSPDGSHAGFPYTLELGKDEKLSLIKTESTYHFNDKL